MNSRCYFNEFHGPYFKVNILKHLLNRSECSLCVLALWIKWMTGETPDFAVVFLLHISFFLSSPTGLTLACSYFAHSHFSSNTSKQLVSHCHPKTTNIWGRNRETAKGNTYAAGFGAVLRNNKSINITGFVNVDGESLTNVKVLFSENIFQHYLQIYS